MKCTLSINRPTVNGVSDAVIELVLRIERGKTITVPVSPADFALALTGKSDVPAELRLRGVSVMPAGMVATALQDLRDRATSAEIPQDDISVATGNFARDAYEQARREGRGEREAFDYAVSAIRAMVEVFARLECLHPVWALCMREGFPFLTGTRVLVNQAHLPPAYGLPDFPVYWTQAGGNYYALTPGRRGRLICHGTDAEFQLLPGRNDGQETTTD